MSAFGTPRELALVAFLVGLVVIHAVVPKIGEAIGGRFERRGKGFGPSKGA